LYEEISQSYQESQYLKEACIHFVIRGSSS